jgi:ribosome-binding protein aMBF1 (putative translation factor)
MNDLLVDAIPIGKRRSFVHLHFASKPHEFREIEEDVYDDALGIQFRNKRREMGLTLRAASKALGISAVIVSDIERGRIIPKEGYTIDDLIAELERAARDR